MPVRKATFAICVALSSSILYLVLHYVTNSIYNVVKEPYMDEIFHIPQAQRYCQSNFTYYDPKLTTPPGLYFLAYSRIWLRDKILMQRSELVCDIMDLRRTNILVAIFNFVTIVLIQLTSLKSLPAQAASSSTSSSRINEIKLNYRIKGFKNRAAYTINNSTTLDLAMILLSAIAITTLPPLFFFNSLFYTDPGSLLFTLLTYLFSINDCHIAASLSGLVSITFRQTNIVWVFYSACLVLLRIFDDHRCEFRQVATKSTPSRLSFAINLFERCLPYGLVGLLFIAFIFLNKGIVLGDKEAHQPKLHFSQMLYFLGFCSVFGFGWMFHLRVLKRFLYLIIRSPLAILVASGLVIYIIAFGRYAHPYLLADNRHITFYIWRRILDRHNSYVPYLLTPIYLLTSLSIWHHLRHRGCKATLLYIFCTLLVTIPNGLLELRYFIIPYVFLRLNNREDNLVCLALELGQNLAINLGMHHLFSHKTFRWADSPEQQRIMW